MSDFLWVEKYRPKKIKDCILPEDTKKTFSEFLKQGEIPNLLLSGTAGTGKTTVARALCEELGADYIIINGSDEGRQIDTLRTNQMALTVGTKRVSVLKTAKHVIATENGNIFALFRGLTPRLTRVMIEMGLLFSLYEKFYEIIEDVV